MNYTIEGDDTQLSFYKHNTVTESYYCIICTYSDGICGTYTMKTADSKQWNFIEEDIPPALKEAEGEISEMIYKADSSQAA